mmetsp:Transcript_18201/g.28331  ORF Transcript_18201/g.28331 Transcript_18201/m.28331 type:complete len:191 (+) Transcript_18201:61-633(+)|eukprot:CAMPEP_0196824352 /NCGR_PEP_ID=MMETSP1362-20130617/91506_1 /TAXON_ID=163516 /ORGANISM="Leptocylindrus danicus, Strain CCMP1856" /LENGTH=190 /DNA_ID=CAMNT_0042204587 /DNA_START=61 /DNA_END=633 /DNA_ORIENTATION=-
MPPSTATAESTDNNTVPALPIRLTSTVVKGFNRGSKDLGIPTANLSRTHCNQSFDQLPCGIYWGFARIESEPTNLYKAAISIGYNPTYGNESKTVEPHFIAGEGNPARTASMCGETVLRDFYGEKIWLSVVGYLRAELPFEGLDKLRSAIKHDIVNSEALCNEYLRDHSDSDDSETSWVLNASAPDDIVA